MKIRNMLAVLAMLGWIATIIMLSLACHNWKSKYELSREQFQEYRNRNEAK